MIKIAKYIPLPTGRGDGKVKELLQLLSPGNSVLLAKRASYHPYYVAAKRLGIKIAIREMGGRKRLWRVK